jgi:hypothetical protein
MAIKYKHYHTLWVKHHYYWRGWALWGFANPTASATTVTVGMSKVDVRLMKTPLRLHILKIPL